MGGTNIIVARSRCRRGKDAVARAAIDAAYADGGGYVVFRKPAKYKVDIDAREIKSA